MFEFLETDQYSARDYLGQSAEEVDRVYVTNPDRAGNLYLVTSQISENYLELIRKYVLPNLKLNDGLKLRELRVLNCVARYESSLQASDVADILCEDPATISRAVRKLEAQQMLHRRACAEDARAKYLVLTLKGREVADEYSEKFHMVSDHLKGMANIQISDEDINEFLRLGERIRAYSRELVTLPPRASRNLF